MLFSAHGHRGGERPKKEELNVREMKLARSANQTRAALRQAELPRHQGEGPGLREEHEGDFR